MAMLRNTIQIIPCRSKKWGYSMRPGFKSRLSETAYCRPAILAGLEVEAGGSTTCLCLFA